MPLRHPFSSPQFPQAPEASRSSLVRLAADAPLPESYGNDSINLLVQSPERIFLYWQHARSPYDTLRKAFADSAAYQQVVRLIDVASGTVSMYEASTHRAQWFEVRPDCAYRAEVGFIAPERPFIRLLASNVARTPPRGVSQHTDSAPEFRVTAAVFARMLGAAGYPEDASEVADEARGEGRGARRGRKHSADAQASTLADENESAADERWSEWHASGVNFGARSSARRRPSSPPQTS